MRTRHTNGASRTSGPWPFLNVSQRDDYHWPVAQPRLPIGFGAFLRDAIHASGFATPTHFARAVGTDPSVVLRWITEEQRPTIRSIERIAPVLGRPIAELVAAAYPDRLGPQPYEISAQLDPLALELARMLAHDSPMTSTDQESLRTEIDRMIEPYRRGMRRRRPA